MEKKHIISICGDLASGKGTVSNILLKDLEYNTIYKNGEYFRKLAKEHGMDVTSFNKYVEEHPEIDIAIEKSAGDIAKTHDKLWNATQIQLIKEYNLAEACLKRLSRSV